MEFCNTSEYSETEAARVAGGLDEEQEIEHPIEVAKGFKRLSQYSSLRPSPPSDSLHDRPVHEHNTGTENQGTVIGRACSIGN